MQIQKHSNLLLSLHIFWRLYGRIRLRLRRWMKAGLAAKAADVAAETVRVGPSGVKRQPARLWVERVFLIDVVVLLLPG